MRRILMCLFIVGLTSGCVTTEYYTRPDSQGYYEQVWGGLCEKCNRKFTFSSAQYKQQQDIQCPYCGCIQNLQMAHSRYEYECQQQETVAAKERSQYWRGQMQKWQEQREAAQEKQKKVISDIYEKKPTPLFKTKRTTIYDKNGNVVGYEEERE